MKRVIVSGDDFGLHSSINEGIEEAFLKGILTSASLVVNGDGVDEAIKIAKRNPGLGIGLHLTLIEEKALIPGNKLAFDGFLPHNHNKLALDILLGKVPISEVISELDAQLKLIFSSGIKITHVDSHRHMHMLPKIWNAVSGLLKKYNINKIRYVNVPAFDYRKDQMFKNIIATGFKVMRVFRSNLQSPDAFIGFMESGNFTPEKFISVIQRLKQGVWEVGMHPGKSDKVLKKKFPDWDTYYDYAFSWEGELKTLVSGKVKDAISLSKIELINYGQLISD